MNLVNTINPENIINHRLNIFLLFLGRLVSDLGTNIFRFALSLYVLDQTKSAGMFSLIISVTILPSIFINIFGATFVDQHNKKNIMIVTDVLSGLLTLFFLFLFQQGSKGIMIFIINAILLTTIQSFFRLSFDSSLLNIVNQPNIARVNSSLQIMFALIGIAGPVLGAIVYKALGLRMVLLIVGIGFVISGFTEIFLVYRKINNSFGKAETNYFKNVKFIFEYLNTRRTYMLLLVFLIIINFLAIPCGMIVLPYISYNVLKVTAFQLSVIQASCSAGMIMGGIFLSIYKSSNLFLKKVFLFSKILSLQMFLWIFPIFKIHSEWLIVMIFSIILFFVGSFTVLIYAPLMTYFQVKIPENIKARFFGVLNTAILISSPLGMWLYGILLEKIYWVYVIIGVAICMYLLCLYGNRTKYYKNFLKSIED